jgi:cobalt-zinc-cadmium efflux system membrane fusion protein
VWSTWLQVASGWALSTFTLASLAAVGWYGHHTHWTFGLAGHDHSDVHDVRDAQEAHDARDATHPDAEAHPAGATATSGPRDDAATPAPQTPGSITFEDAADVRLAGIESVPVRTQRAREVIAVNGVVRYNERRIAQLSVRATGAVWHVEKRMGDTVRQGEVLAIIDSAEVGRLKADFLNALVIDESRHESLAILEEVRDAIMGSKVREARSAAREARNTLLSAEQALVNLGFDLSRDELAPLSDDARADYMRLLGLPEEVYAGVDSERVSSNLLPLRAPFDGVVINRDVVIGEITDPSRSIFEVVDLSAMWIVLNVSKEDAPRLAIGQQVTFRPDGDDREYVSDVSWISTEVDETTRTLQVRAEVKTGQPAASTERLAGLRANAFGRGSIEVDARRQVQVVPVESLQALVDGWVVFVPPGVTTFEVRRVGRGLESGGTVELVGDLAGVTHVVGPGSHVLKSQLLLDGVESGDL